MRRWQFPDRITHLFQSLRVRGGLNRRYECGVQLIGAQRIGQLAEVHLQQRRHRVYVLAYRLVRVKGRYAILVEGVPQSLDVGRDTAQTVDAVHQAVILDELGAASQNFWN